MRNPRRTRVAAALRLVWIPALVAGLVVAAGAADEAPPAAPAAQRFGQLVRLTSPIGDASERRLRRAAGQLVDEARHRGAQPVLIVQIEPGPNDFGRAVDVARLLTGPELAPVHTVAFLPETLTGHGVLIALACDEIIMAPEAELGNAGAGETVIGPDLRSVYREIAERTHTVPADLALGLLDPQAEVHLVETDVGREFVLAQRIEELQAQHTLVSDEVLSHPGQPLVIAARRARELGLVSFLAADAREAAQALGLPNSAATESLALAEGWRPFRVKLEGELGGGSVRRWQRLIEAELESPGARLLLLEIDSPGGSPEDAMVLASYLASLPADTVRTVAFVPREARGEAAWVALACDDLVLAEGAQLGGAGPYPLGEVEAAAVAKALGQIAAQKLHSPALAQALVDPRIEAFHCRRRADGASAVLTRGELDQAPGVWEVGPPLRPTGKDWLPDPAEAEAEGLSRATVRDFAELCQLLALEDQPVAVEPTWVDRLVEVLNLPGVGWLLLVVGFTGLYIELHTPGLGIAGLAGGLAFVLLLWSKVLGGTADWLEVVLFLSGIACLAIELMVLPGFGVFGFVGALLVLLSLVLASQTFLWPHNAYELHALEGSLLQLAGGALGSMALALLLRRYLFVRPLFGAAVLAPPDETERAEISRREALVRLDHLLGKIAPVATRLSPAGKIEVDGQWIDVVSDGEIIDPGQQVEVIAVHGNRVVVRRVR